MIKKTQGITRLLQLIMEFRHITEQEAEIVLEKWLKKLKIVPVQ